VTFGAEAVFKSKISTVTDEDIDAILARGEERTAAMSEKIKRDMQHNLMNFTISAEDDKESSFSLIETEKKTHGMLMVLPQRERKSNYNVDNYYRGALG